MKTRAGGWRCLSLESGWAGESLCLCPLKHSCKAKGQRLPGCLTSKAAQQAETPCFTKGQGKKKRKSRSIAFVFGNSYLPVNSCCCQTVKERSAKENPCCGKGKAMALLVSPFPQRVVVNQKQV